MPSKPPEVVDPSLAGVYYIKLFPGFTDQIRRPWQPPWLRRSSLSPKVMDQTASSHGTSWADQWDYGQDPPPSTSNGGTVKRQMSVGLEKTKTVAVAGANKVKEGASLGIRWIKDKYGSVRHRH